MEQFQNGSLLVKLDDWRHFPRREFSGRIRLTDVFAQLFLGEIGQEPGEYLGGAPHIILFGHRLNVRTCKLRQALGQEQPSVGRKPRDNRLRRAHPTGVVARADIVHLAKLLFKNCA